MKIRDKIYDRESQIYRESKESEKILCFIEMTVVRSGIFAGKKYLVIDPE